MKIDVHSHWLPPAYLDAASIVDVRRIEGGIDVAGTHMVGAGLSPDLLQGSDRVQDWVDRLDAADVDHLIMSPSPLLYVYDAANGPAAEFARFKNETIAEFTATRSDRLSWLATLPLQDPGASVEEIARVSAAGARGVHLGAVGLGPWELDSADLWPVYEALEAAGLSISLHPNPFANVLGERSSYVLEVFPGYIHQETLAFVRMALGGVFDDFPDLVAYLPHAGGAVPFQLGRLEAAQIPELDNRAKRPLRDYLPNFYFDLLLEDVGARRFAAEVIGFDRLLVGDNFGAIDEVDGFAELAECGFGDDAFEQVAARNPSELFGIPLSADTRREVV